MVKLHSFRRPLWNRNPPKKIFFGFVVFFEYDDQRQAMLEIWGEYWDIEVNRPRPLFRPLRKRRGMLESWADSWFIISVDFFAVFGIVVFVLFIPTTPSPPIKNYWGGMSSASSKLNHFFERLLLHGFLRSYVPKKIGMVVFVLFVDYLDTQWCDGETHKTLDQ